jgi:hypothetical protein
MKLSLYQTSALALGLGGIFLPRLWQLSAHLNCGGCGRGRRGGRGGSPQRTAGAVVTVLVVDDLVTAVTSRPHRPALGEHVPVRDVLARGAHDATGLKRRHHQREPGPYL